MEDFLHLGHSRVLLIQLLSLDNVNFAKLTVRHSFIVCLAWDDCPPTPKSNWLFLSALWSCVIVHTHIPFGPPWKPGNIWCYIIHTGANVNTCVIACDWCGRSHWPRQVEFKLGPSQLSGSSHNIRQSGPKHQQVPTSDVHQFHPRASVFEHLTQVCREIHALGQVKGGKKKGFSDDFMF